MKRDIIRDRLEGFAERRKQRKTRILKARINHAERVQAGTARRNDRSIATEGILNMTADEAKANEFLICAHENLKGAWNKIHPKPQEPVGTMIQRALDSIDAARKELAKRNPR